jgi:hypothetical protein
MIALNSLISRVLFIGAFILAGLAVLEKFVNVAGYTVLRGSYVPSRLLEISAVTLMFVIALQLRDIHHSLTGRAKV